MSYKRARAQSTSAADGQRDPNAPTLSSNRAKFTNNKTQIQSPASTTNIHSKSPTVGTSPQTYTQPHARTPIVRSKPNATTQGTSPTKQSPLKKAEPFSPPPILPPFTPPKSSTDSQGQDPPTSYLPFPFNVADQITKESTHSSVHPIVSILFSVYNNLDYPILVLLQNEQKEHNIVYCNQKGEDLLGWKKIDLLGMTNLKN